MADNSWKQYGQQDPYFGVCSDPRYRSKNLTDEALKNFFQSGEEHIADVVARLNTYFPSFKTASIKSVLDFGCGTGRLLIPLAKRYEKVTGIDISEGMLAEAEKNIKAQQLNNVSLILSGDITTIQFDDQFDLIHTFIVLQHIPVKIGYTIIDTLLRVTRAGGYGMIHLTYANNRSPLQNRQTQLKAKYQWIRKVSNIMKGRPMNIPVMQMNNYDLTKVFGLLNKHGVKQTGLDYTDHGGFYGLCIYYSK
jgi:2-polyprenyl-3-methyl-5-hydroxy-6-metoxy-1,4-benzoquinol methylase